MFMSSQVFQENGNLVFKMEKKSMTAYSQTNTYERVFNVETPQSVLQ